MINRSIELEATLCLALEALEKAIRYGSFHGADWAFNEIEEAITTIKAALEAHKALARPEPEPVAWDGDCVLGHCGSPAGCEASNCCRADSTAPYVATPRPQHSANALKPLTIDQIASIAIDRSRTDGIIAFARAIEAAHGIKE